MDPRQDAGGTVRSPGPRPGRIGQPAGRIPRPGPLQRRFADDADLDSRSGHALPGVDEAGTLFEVWRRSRRAGLAERIFDLTAPRLRLLAGSLLADANDVDDVLQETYLIAFAHPERYAKDRPLLPWLGGILRNRVRMVMRSSLRRRRHESSGGHSNCDTATECTVHPHEGFEVVEVVQRGIENLPSTYRQVVARRVLDGAAFPAIAAELGRTENTVRVQCGRGLHMLRRTLPAGVGACLAMAMLPDGIAAATRDVVVQAAARPPIGPDPASAVPTRSSTHLGPITALRTWRTVAAALLLGTVMLAVWIASDPSATPQTTPPSRPEAREPLVAAVAPAGDAVAADAAQTHRTSVVSAPTAALRVRVTLHGRPVAHAGVSVEPFDPRNLFLRTIHDDFGSRSVPEHPVPHDAARGLTDEQGIATLAAGPGQLLVRGPGGGALVSPKLDRSKPLELELGERAVEIRGRVLDPAAGSGPIELLVRSGPYALVLDTLAVVDEAGDFSTVVGRGSAVCARRGNYCSEVVEIGRAGAEPLSLVLRPGASVSGTVQGPDGLPAADAQIDVAAGRLHRRARTDGLGRFELLGLPPGDLWVAAHSPTAGISPREALELQPGARRALRLALGGVGRITGRVTDRDGHPVAGTRVRTGWTFDALAAASTATDENGCYALDGVPAGSLRIEAGLGEAGMHVGQLSLEAGQDLRWDPVLDRNSLQLRARFALPADAPPLFFAVDTRDHLVVRAIPVTDGTVTIQVDPDAADRQFTGRLYHHSAVDSQGRILGFPLAVYRGLRAGIEDQELTPPADCSAAASLFADIVPGPEVTGEVRVSQLPSGHWIKVGTFHGRPGERIALRQEGLPAGRYQVHIGSQTSIDAVEVSAGEHVELGVLVLDRRDDRAGQQVRLTFEHPGDGTPMDRLTVELVEAHGQRTLKAQVPGAQGLWSHTFTVPPGRWELAAHTGNGLTTHASLEVFADRPLSRRLPLARVALADDTPK